MEVAAAFGWTLNRMWNAGFGILVRRQQIEYLREALMDDEIEIATWLSEIKRSTSIWHFTITRVKNNELLARARTLCVGIDPKTRSLKRMPEEILGNLRALESDPSVSAAP
jgi:YbgC/YbaW family acyl-CoA thioester hydrolase